MRILLTAVDSKYIHSNLALRYLKKLAEQKNCEVGFLESTINDEVDKILADIVHSRADLVIFSCYIWNIACIRQLIGALHQVMPETLILCGGPEVAYDAETFLKETPAHAVMAGEGEVIFPAVLEQLAELSGGSSVQAALEILAQVPGLYLSGPQIRWTGSVPLADMSLVPFPYDEADLEVLKHRIIYYEGQRGCPYGCSYCLSSIDRTLRHKPLAMVRQELAIFMEAGVPLVKFVDRTFNVREEWAHGVLLFILEETLAKGHHTSFHFEVGAATLSERLIELLNQAPPDLFQIEAGIQSTDASVLVQIQRQDDPQKLAQTISRILAKGNVHVHTDLIAGLPGDTLASFRKSFNDCIRMGPQMLQVGFLKVLKGTPLYQNRHQLGIAYRSWPPYEVLQTRQMSFEDLQLIKRVEEVTDKYFNSGNFPCSIRYLLNNSQEPWELFINLAEYLLISQADGKTRKFEDYYRVILEIGKKMEPAKASLVADMLRFDYVLSNRKGFIPEWLQNNKYNSSRGRLITGDNDNFLLKGNVVGFKINMLRFWQSGEILVEDSLIFYSLATPDLIPVKHRSGMEYLHA